jgi:hypothetical protein
VLQALTDFSDNRLKLWRTLDPRQCVVHQVGETSADVTEGTSMPPVGSFRGREHYDWSTQGVVRATVSNSSLADDGGIWEFHVEPGANSGSHVTVNFDRTLHGAKGTVLSIFLGLFAKQAFRSNLLKTLKILEQQPSA